MRVAFLYSTIWIFVCNLLPGNLDKIAEEFAIFVVLWRDDRNRNRKRNRSFINSEWHLLDVSVILREEFSKGEWRYILERLYQLLYCMYMMEYENVNFRNLNERKIDFNLFVYTF